MKLAFLCNNMKSTNGVERVLSQRLSLLAESGMYEVYLITYNQYGAPFSFPISDKVHYIDLATRYIERCSYHGLFQYVDRFCSKLFYKRTIQNCLKRIAPDVITSIDVYLADLQAVLDSGIEAVKIVECHCGLSAYFGDLERIQSIDKRSKERKIKERFVQTILRFDRIIVMTENEKIDWGTDKVVCIPNMLPNCPSDFSDKKQINHRVISVGRYAYQKGFDMLLDSWKYVQEKHPDWSLHIYGSRDGDRGDFELLNSMIVAGSMRNVFLHQPANDVYSEYDKSDIYVMSSRFESFGLVLIEAMAFGLPVISFDCKYGPRSIIHDGITGIIVPSKHIEKMAEAICAMIENENKRHCLLTNARQESMKYLPETIMPLWHEFYKSLGKGHPIDA